MAGKKKFGAFAGVFTPSILTILGVIMYMRMGWVIGSAGLVGTIAIVLLAHIIAISTGLSVSSVATDKKIGAGGIYYVLSRSMGIPIGGSIGMTLYVGTAFSIALYLIGFAESFNGYFGFETSINALRITGTIALVALIAIALISTSVALKTQFFILATIIISLISIVFGTSEYVPQKVNLFASEGAVPLETVFAIFFPAVTGFTAGIAMSGDLKDPKKDIPIGTLAAIGVGLVVYLSLAFFIAYHVDSETLKSDYNILMKIAFYAPAVVAGIWGATLSSALGGILGGPRILQAMSLDKVTPKVFGKGKGKNNEPVNALILVFIIAEAGILIGELDVIARVVSMFFLAAYGFINISYFLESWANPDFQPTFKIKRWIGLVGFLACFGVMFKLDVLAMFGAFIVIGGLYFWLQRKQIQLQSSDVWQSVWSNVVNKGLKRLEAKESENSNWNPNIILFSGESEHRSYLLELGNTVSGRIGMVTNFKLIVDKDSDKPFAKTKQIVKDSAFEKLGIFARQVKVENIYKGIIDIASTFGFSGVEPNTIMMGWPKLLSNSADYSKMTQTLLHLDYNLLYLDFDRKAKFGKYQTVDLWWRETDGKNAEMMLNIARFIIESPKWNKTKIRVLFVNNNNIDKNIIKTKISKLVEDLRVNVEIKIINNGVEQKSFYDLIALQSASTDLTLVGIPNYKIEQQAEFVLKTNHLFETIGSTLLVKASNNFNLLDLDFVQKETFATKETTTLNPLVTSRHEEINDLISEFDSHLSKTAKHLAEPAFKSLSSNYFQFIDNAKYQFQKTIQTLEKNHSANKVAREIQVFLNQLIASSDHFKNKKLPEIEALLKLSITSFVEERTAFLQKTPKRIKYVPANAKSNVFFSTEKKIYWRKIVGFYYKSKILPNTEQALNDFGIHNFIILNKLTDGIKEQALLFIEKINKNNEIQEESLGEFTSNIAQLLDRLSKESLHLGSQTVDRLNTFERDICIELTQNIEDPDFYKKLKKESNKLKRTAIKQAESNISEYASHWYRNQTLAHEQLQADFNLSTAGLSVFLVNNIIKSRIHRKTITPQQNEIKLFTASLDYINEHLGDEELDNYSDKTIDKLIESIPHIDFNDILKNEEDRILSISGKTPEYVHLMSADSFNNLQNCQNDDVEAIEVSLLNIQNYIIRSSYLNPLQNSLHSLELVFKENGEELYNASNLVKHILSEPLTDENLVAYKNNLSLVQKKISDCLTELKKIEASFDYDLNVHINNTLRGLNIRTVIESIDSYSKVSGKPVIKTNFQNWYDKRKKSIGRIRSNVFDFIVQRKRDVDSIKFIEKHNRYLNHIEQTNKFVNDLSFNEGIENELSFYYKKLFTGSHLGNVNPVYKKNELTAAKNTIARIDSGVSGAIMVLGESLSGKTYFIETISNTLIEGEKVYISPPANQNYNGEDIQVALQNAFNKRGTAESILNQIGHKTILIFDDLEKWWVKAPSGNATINYLSKLIEKFGNKHYFILSCNIFSFDVIRKVSSLDKQLLATIIVPPASKLELKEILLSRHRTAGVELWYHNHQISEAKKMDALFNDVHYKSHGNVGVALGVWISRIKKGEEDRLVISKSQSIHFPEIDKPNWKIILYHMTIHGSLKKEQIEKIFEDTDWVYDTLKELEKTALIYKKSNTIYALNNSARHYVEDWLKDLKIL